MKRLALFFIATYFSGNGHAASIPDLVCQELKVVFVDPKSLATRSYDSRTIYRFKSGDLFLSSPDRVEYRYNEVTQVEPMRFMSGHKTLIFESDDYSSVVFVHTFGDEIRVSRATCNRT